jgi:hypothetical protein
LVYGKRLPFPGSQEFPNSFDHTIWLRTNGNSDKDRGFPETRKLRSNHDELLVGSYEQQGHLLYLDSVDASAGAKMV